MRLPRTAGYRLGICPISRENSAEGLDQLGVTRAECQPLILGADILEQENSVLSVLHEEEEPHILRNGTKFHSFIQECIGYISLFVEY